MRAALTAISLRLADPRPSDVSVRTRLAVEMARRMT